MIQFFLLLIGISIASAYPSGLEPDIYEARVTAAVVPGLCLLYALVGAVIARTYLRRFLQAKDEPNQLFTSFLRCMALYRALLLAVYALQVYVFLWPSFVAFDLGLSGVIIAEELVKLAPFPVALFLSWIPLYRLDRLLKGSDWSFRAYIVFQTRLVIGPVLGIVVLLHLVVDGVQKVPRLAKLLERYPALDLLLFLGVFSLMFLAAPVLLRLAWGGRRLPAGPLRDRLLAACRRAGLSVRDFLIWETFGGRFANALVTGILPRLRYVFFTRSLLDGLEPEEVEAVLAHELGHARHRHLVWYAAFGLGLILLGTGLDGALGIGGVGLANGALQVVLVIVFWSFLFLVASRRFEGQADLFSLHLLGTTAPLASALLKVAALNGAPPGARSVTHGSIADRVLFLQQAQADPRVAARVERRVAPIRGVIGSVLAAGVVVSAASVILGWGRPATNRTLERAQELFTEAMAAKEAERYEVALRLLHEARVLVPGSPVPWIEIGNCEELRGNLPAARAAFARTLNPRPNECPAGRGPWLPDPWHRAAVRRVVSELDAKISSSNDLQPDPK